MTDVEFAFVVQKGSLDIFLNDKGVGFWFWLYPDFYIIENRAYSYPFSPVCEFTRFDNPNILHFFIFSSQLEFFILFHEFLKLNIL